MAIHFRTLDFMQIKGFSLHLGYGFYIKTSMAFLPVFIYASNLWLNKYRKNSFTYDAVEAFMLEFRKIVPYIS